MEKIYCVKDNQGNYEGHLSIQSNSMTKRNANWKWDYYSQKIPTTCSLIKENCELKVMKLRELNLLAEYNLDWEVVEFSEQEFMGIRVGLIGDISGDNCNYSNIEIKDIRKGYICRHRKMVRDIYKKYECLMKKLV